MPLSYSDVGDLIAEGLDSSGEKIVSYSWPDFYRINEAATLRESRKDEIKSYCFEEHQILIAYGDKAIIVCRDRFINRIRVRSS